MHVLVRMMNSGVSVAIPTSRTTKISDLKTLVEKKFDVKPENQRLFFAGKQLENQYSLFDYSININDVIQLMVMASVTKTNSTKKIVKKVPKNLKDETNIQSCSTATSSVIKEDDIKDISEESKYFKLGDYVDIRDYEYGVWYMGKIVKIKKDISVENGQPSSVSQEERDGLIYFVEDAGAPNNPPAEVTLKDIRPYSTENLPFDQLQINDKVLMNYNTEHPKERGYWYDVQVKQIKVNRRNREVIGDVTLGTNKAVLTNCQLMFLDDILKIKPYKLVAERTEEDDAIMQIMPSVEIVASVTENNSIKKSPLKAPNNSKDGTYIQSCSTATSPVIEEDDIEDISENSKYFKLGDYVDIRDFEYGLWYMGKIVKIKKDNSVENGQTSSATEEEHDGLIYFVEDAGASNDPPTEVTLKDLRPYSTENLPFNQLKINDKVLMNYNTEHPKERGYWYDVQVKQITVNRRNREVIGDIILGSNKAVLNNCRLMFLDDILKIKSYKLVAERTEEDDAIMQTMPSAERAGALTCTKCKDNVNKLCVHCGCSICGGKEDEGKQLMCDECNEGFHISCLSPPLTEIPEDDEWFCPTCKNDENEIVKAGGKLKATKKKTLASTSKRDLGKGMACVGRTKKCNIVPPNHFGAIPGVEVGTTWLFRVQVSESGIHRPPVGGIHGRDNQGAFSIVLSGGYEDDIDNGDEFMYTGSGGRDLSGNKRTALQSCDQELTRNNRALALNCNAEINDKEGATAVDWKKGKPVRVVRNYKLHKHSKYAPEVGNRYDGLYKVTKYYPETGISGFVVWRFLLKRDDPAPAPWTAKGKKRIAQLGLEIIYPENYMPSTRLDNTKLPGSNRKRTLQDTDVENNETDEHLPKSKDEEKGPEKKAKIHYKLEKEAEELIKADAANKKYWDDCKELLKNSKKAFLDRVEETFMCICCQDIVYEPITLDCSHNICKGCLKRSFASNVYQCPSCRAELGKTYLMNINTMLANTLLYFFPGYHTGR